MLSVQLIHTQSTNQWTVCKRYVVDCSEIVTSLDLDDLGQCTTLGVFDHRSELALDLVM